MSCEEQGRLLDLYREAVSHYSATVNDMHLTRGKITKEEYDRLLRTTNKARADSETAYFSLERHVDKHGCQTFLRKPRGQI